MPPRRKTGALSSKRFRLIRTTEHAASLIGEIELAAFSVGTAESQEETDVAYVGLNAARARLYAYIEGLEIESPLIQIRTHQRRF